MRIETVYLLNIIALVILAGVAGVLMMAGTPVKLVPETEVHRIISTAPSENKTVLMTYNIHYGSGYYDKYIENASGDDVYRYLDMLANLTKDADIVTLQEVDVSMRRSHFVNEAEYLAKKAGFSYWTFSDNWNFKMFPNTDPVNFRKLRTGHVILSKYPIAYSRTVMFEKPSASLWHKMTFLWRTQQYADIDVDGKTLRVFNVHLESESKQDREDQAVQLAEMIRASPHETIIMGDFNALVPEATKKDFPREDYTDDTTMTTIRSAGLNELFPEEEYIENESAHFTFTSKNLTRRLDYMFYSDSIKVISANILDEPDASDHLPTLIEMKMKE